MSGRAFNVLLVEDNPGDIRLIDEMLKEARNVLFEVECVGTLTMALNFLAERAFDVVVLDLLLPDSQGFDTLLKIITDAPTTAVVVLTAMNNEAAGLKALQHGAQDYLLKDQADANTLARSLRYAIERKQAERERADLLAREQQARREAEKANALKLMFLAMISHELRTPLTSIKGFATTLLAEDVIWDAGSQQGFIKIINEEADKLTDLVEQLLDVSRLEAGTLRIDTGQQGFDTILDTALPQLKAIAKAHQLVFDIPDDLPPVVADIDL
jgi:signal transduction histidine kinase